MAFVITETENMFFVELQKSDQDFCFENNSPMDMNIYVYLKTNSHFLSWTAYALKRLLWFAIERGTIIGLKPPPVFPDSNRESIWLDGDKTLFFVVLNANGEFVGTSGGGYTYFKIPAELGMQSLGIIKAFSRFLHFVNFSSRSVNCCYAFHRWFETWKSWRGTQAGNVCNCKQRC